MVPWEYVPPSSQALRWVEHRVGPASRVVSVSRLHGGITAAIDAVEVDDGSADSPRRLVLRRWYIDEARRERLVARETAALLAVEASTVPAPRVVGYDADGSEAGVPCTLTTELTGAPDLAPSNLADWLLQLAATQAAIHAVPGTLPDSWDGFYTPDAPLEWLPDRGLREAARHAVDSGSPDRQAVLGHGDYQHFNVLWDAGRLTGVVDWPNAAMTPRGVDVGHCRLNLAVLFSVAAAEDYLAAYERAAGVRVDPASDLRSVLNFDATWQEFIPIQVHGRAPVDVDGMPGRVADLVRRIMARLG